MKYLDPTDPDNADNPYLDMSGQAVDLPADQVTPDTTGMVTPNGVPNSVYGPQIPPALVNAAQTPDQKLLSLTNGAPSNDLRNALLEQSQNAIDEQKAGVAKNEKALNDFQNQGPAFNYQPLNSLVDAWTGSKFGQNYTQPMSPEERQQKLMTLNDALLKQKQGLTTDQLGLLKSLTMPSLANLDLRTENAAGKIAQKFTNDKIIQPAQLAVNGADRIQGLLDNVKSGKLVDTGQFLNNLSQEVAKLETGKQNFAEGSAERSAYETAYGDVARIAQKITANPQSVDMPKLLDQLQKSIYEMRNSYVNNIHQQANILKTNYSNPQLSAAQDQAINSLLSTYNKKPPPTQFKGFGTEGKKAKPMVPSQQTGAPMSYEDWKAAGKPGPGE